MHARTKPRTEPYVWATWISKLLAGESSCLWSAWFRAHNHLGAKIETDFDLQRWQLDHTAITALSRCPRGDLLQRYFFSGATRT
jgi:hypothetical protein